MAVMKSGTRRSGLRRWLAGFAIASLLWLGLGMPSAQALTDGQKLIAEVWRIVNRAYVDDSFNHQNWWFVRQRLLRRSLNDQAAVYDAIDEMVGSLGDPYTRFLPPEQYRSLRTNTAGELTGVGLQIAKEEESGALRVIAPIEGSPAEAAGMQPKDTILKINGLPTDRFTLDEAASRMRGTLGTKVTLTVKREDEAEPFDVTLTRDNIVLNPVVADLRQAGDLALGYIRLSQFNGNAAAEVSTALRQLEDQGAEAYILDLRNNPGGLLQAGIEIARLWLDQGTVVYTVNRQGVLDSFEASGPAVTQDPLVVLVNQGTASASEILAGALQDNGRAQLVGDVTFGKGLIQSLFDLSDGSGLAVTIAKYETPAHHDINQLGITPDRAVEQAPLLRRQFGTPEDAQYQAAVDLLQSSTVAEVGPPRL